MTISLYYSDEANLDLFVPSSSVEVLERAKAGSASSYSKILESLDFEIARNKNTLMFKAATGEELAWNLAEIDPQRLVWQLRALVGLQVHATGS